MATTALCFSGSELLVHIRVHMKIFYLEKLAMLADLTTKNIIQQAV
jgi:hypothetical protein